MANIAIFRINYKSDFILTLNSDAGWMTPFCIKFWTGAPSQAYFVGFDGTTYTHCAPVDGDPTKLRVQFDDHHLPIGDLKFQIAYHFTVADFPISVEDEVLNQASVIIEEDDAPAQVMLDFNGETAPEIEFSLPAYANEAQRIANEEARIAAEQQRIDHETARVNEFATLKSQSQAATRDANDAATLANQKAQLAADKAELADDAATLANQKAQLAADKAALANDAAQLAADKAALAQQKAEYAQQQGSYAKDQGDYAKSQGNYAKEQGEIVQADHVRAEADHGIAVDDHTQAGNDHTRAEADHGIAVDDHTQAGNDHTRAESDHGIAADDHTQAGNDHTRAESDHTRAESDHAAVEVYVDSLGVFDLSKHNAVGGVLATYADLSAALNALNALESKYKYGGMSFKFVQTYDNKYVQFRLMAQSFTTDVTQWQGVDDEPIFESKNLVESGGVEKQIENFVKLFAIFGTEETVSYGDSTYDGGLAGLYSAFPINKNGKYLTAIECKLSPSDSNLYLIKVSNETIISFIKIEWASIGIELVNSVHKYDLSALMKIGSEGDYIAINKMSYTTGSRPSDLLAFSNISIGKTNDSFVYTPFANIYFANIEKNKTIIGDISDLDTENKTSIVNAINEISDDMSDYIGAPVSYPYNIDATPNISGGYVFAFPVKTAGLLKSITAKFSSDSGRIGIGKVNGTRLSITENLNITPIVGEKRVYDLTLLNKIVDLTDYIVIQWHYFIKGSAPSSCDAVGCQSWDGTINSPALFTPYFQYDIIPESKIKDEFGRLSNTVEQIVSDVTILDDKVDVLERKTTLNRGIYCLGDSTTFGFGSEYSSIDGITRGTWSWSDILNTKIQFKEYHKLAVSGAVAMKDTRQGYTGKPALMLQVNSVPKNYTGIITVMIGTNDIADEAPLGDVDNILTMPFSELEDENSFAESYRLCMETLSRNSPEAIILAMMPVSPTNGENYIEIEKKICNALSIPVINTRNECGLNSLCNSGYFFADTLHPNENGYRRIAEYMAKIIEPYVGTTNEVELSGSVKDSSDAAVTNLHLEFKTPQPNNPALSIIYSINTNSDGNFRLLVPKATYSIKCNSEYTLNTTEITLTNDTVVNLIATAI